MLQALKQAFRSDHPTVPPALALHLEALRAAETVLLTEYQAATLAAADGQASQSDADKAHAALVHHRELIQRHLDLTAAAAKRDEVERKSAARQALANQFEQAKKAAETVAKLATRTEAAAAAFVEAVHAQREATANLHSALPSQFPQAQRDGLWLESDDLQMHCRRHFEHLRLWSPIEPLHPFQPFALKYQQAVPLLAARSAQFMSRQP